MRANVYRPPEGRWPVLLTRLTMAEQTILHDAEHPLHVLLPLVPVS